jgi:ABC-type multidrug transport system fused ATPase/permease subunit
MAGTTGAAVADWWNSVRPWALLVGGFVFEILVVASFIGGRFRRRLFPGFQYLTLRERYEWSRIRERRKAYVAEVRRIFRESPVARFALGALVALIVSVVGSYLVITFQKDFQRLPFGTFLAVALIVIFLSALLIVPVALTGAFLKWAMASMPIPLRETLPERLQRLTRTLDESLITLATLEQEIGRRRKAVAEIEEREALAELSQPEREAVARQLEIELRRASRTSFWQNAFFFVAGLVASWLLQRLT